MPEIVDIRFPEGDRSNPITKIVKNSFLEIDGLPLLITDSQYYGWASNADATRFSGVFGAFDKTKSWQDRLTSLPETYKDFGDINTAKVLLDVEYNDSPQTTYAVPLIELLVQRNMFLAANYLISHPAFNVAVKFEELEEGDKVVNLLPMLVAQYKEVYKYDIGGIEHSQDKHAKIKTDALSMIYESIRTLLTKNKEAISAGKHYGLLQLTEKELKYIQASLKRIDHKHAEVSEQSAKADIVFTDTTMFAKNLSPRGQGRQVATEEKTLLQLINGFSESLKICVKPPLDQAEAVVSPKVKGEKSTAEQPSAAKAAISRRGAQADLLSAIKPSGAAFDGEEGSALEIKEIEGILASRGSRLSFKGGAVKPKLERQGASTDLSGAAVTPFGGKARS